MEGAEVAMMEMNAEATWKVMENLLKHGKYNIVTRNAMENAVRLLKEQEAVKPRWIRDIIYPAGAFACGACGERIVEEGIDFYCPSCGRPVLWEGR